MSDGLRAPRFKIHSTSHREGGFVLYLDITEQRLQREQIQVLGRVLRHDLRNSLQVARGYTDRIARGTAPGESDADVERVRSATGELLERADRTRTIRHYLERDPPKPERVEITGIVREQVGDERESFDDVEFEFGVDEPGRCYAQAHQTLGVVVGVLVGTLVEHTDQPQPRGAVTVDAEAEQSSEQVVVRIADSGTGLAEQGLIPLRTGEAPSRLRHATDVDVWMAKWFVDQFGGNRRVRASDPGGTTFDVGLSPVRTG